MNRDRQSELDKEIRDAVKENKYHLVQNYNNDLIRRSLKSQNNHNRLNIKEHKANIHLENIAKRIDERYKKRVMTVATQGHNQFKSLAAQKRQEDYKLDIPHTESAEKVNPKAERGSNLSYAGQSVSSSATPNSNMSVVMNKSGAVQGKKEHQKIQETVLQTNNQNIAVRNSLIQKLKKRNASKASSRSDHSQVSRDQSGVRGTNQQALKSNPAEKASRQIDDRVLHLTLNGARHNTNLVQINNYINKAIREDMESAGVTDNKSHRHSSSSNNSNLNSIKLRNIRKAIAIVNKDSTSPGAELVKARNEAQNPLKQGGRTQYNQQLLSNIQNKNVLTLTQNLLHKRNKND